MSDDEGAPLSVWIGLSVITVLAFWSQAAVTEERFVPALNVIATKFNIPDDIAGATLMAAGASSPELFSSIMALFVTHSALGLGVSDVCRFIQHNARDVCVMYPLFYQKLV
jgi:Ca2+/Na+ antiporter